MKDKVLMLSNKLKDLMKKFYSWSPVFAGICIGYAGKPIIDIAIKLIVTLIKKAL